jgi:hypothetical protein
VYCSIFHRVTLCSIGSDSWAAAHPVRSPNSKSRQDANFRAFRAPNSLALTVFENSDPGL